METKFEWVRNHRRELMAGFAVLAVIVLIIGLCLSWFVYNKELSTVGSVRKPATLKILGPNKTAMEQIDLSYAKDEVKDGQVDLKRGFCVKSNGDPFELQLANTTNIEGLKITLYRVRVQNSAPADGIKVGNDTWWAKNPGTDILSTFTPINEQGTSGVAFAPSGNNDPTFENNKNVQINAAPIYRYKVFNEGNLDKDSDGNPGNYTNFIIEFQWEERLKETDEVYLIAKDITNSSKK